MITYLELADKIKDAVREKAKDVPLFKKNQAGAIRITAFPHCAEAYAWLNGNVNLHYSGLENFDFEDSAICERTYPIVKGGKLTNDFGSRADPKRVDFYSYTAMKIAYLLLIKDNLDTVPTTYKSSMSCRLKYDKDIIARNGYGVCDGAVCVPIAKEPINNILCGDFDDPYDFIDLCISVSGANPEEDEMCALAGLEVFEEFDPDNGLFIGFGGKYED